VSVSHGGSLLVLVVVVVSHGGSLVLVLVVVVVSHGGSLLELEWL